MWPCGCTGEEWGISERGTDGCLGGAGQIRDNLVLEAARKPGTETAVQRSTEGQADPAGDGKGKGKGKEPSAKEKKARKEMTEAVASVKKEVSRYNSSIADARKLCKAIEEQDDWQRWNSPHFKGELDNKVKAVDAAASSPIGQLFLEGANIDEVVSTQKKKLGDKAFKEKAKEFVERMHNPLEALAKCCQNLRAMQKSQLELSPTDQDSGS